jgi:hypothetical protein
MIFWRDTLSWQDICISFMLICGQKRKEITMKKMILLTISILFLFSGCLVVPPGQVKKQIVPGQITAPPGQVKKITGKNPASGKWK